MALETVNNLLVVKECLIDYVGPLFIIGNIDWILDEENVMVISATMPYEEFIILNNRIPKWTSIVKSRIASESNILVIKDMDKISVDRQEMLLDMLKDNSISSEELPQNLKIILNSVVKCDINKRIRDLVECYEV